MSSMTLAEFADKVTEVMPFIMREFMKQVSDEFYKVKVTMPQMVIMEILEREKEAKMSDLARYLHVSTAAVTGVMDRLVRDSYAVRSEDPDDRRIVNIKLTQKGTTLIRNMNEKRKEITIKVFGKLSQADRESYLRILNNIKEGMGS